MIFGQINLFSERARVRMFLSKAEIISKKFNVLVFSLTVLWLRNENIFFSFFRFRREVKISNTPLRDQITPGIDFQCFHSAHGQRLSGGIQFLAKNLRELTPGHPVFRKSVINTMQTLKCHHQSYKQIPHSVFL